MCHWSTCVCLCVWVFHIAHYNKCSVIRITARATFIHSTFASKKNDMRYNTFYTFSHHEFLLSSFFPLLSVFIHISFPLTFVWFMCIVQTFLSATVKCFQKICMRKDGFTMEIPSFLLDFLAYGFCNFFRVGAVWGQVKELSVNG